jgi:hypothetical protein
MTCACLSDQKKMYISIQTALIALVLYNPMIFQAVRGLLGNWVSSAEGCPSTMGLLLHTLIFGVVLYLLMKPSSKTPRQSVQSLPLQ